MAKLKPECTTSAPSASEGANVWFHLFSMYLRFPLWTMFWWKLEGGPKPAHPQLYIILLLFNFYFFTWNKWHFEQVLRGTYPYPKQKDPFHTAFACLRGKRMTECDKQFQYVEEAGHWRHSHWITLACNFFAYLLQFYKLKNYIHTHIHNTNFGLCFCHFQSGCYRLKRIQQWRQFVKVQ